MASTASMETVLSSDGTKIAFERTGSGPPLVLVHGVAGDHARWELGDVRSALANHHTVYAIDRRGRGESGDAASYELEREFEDVAAVVDTIDEPANALGHSHGAVCVLGGALLTDNLRSLIVYEPPIPWAIIGPDIFDEAVVSEMEELLRVGEEERSLVVFMRDVLKLSPEQLEAARSDPTWQARVDTAATIPRELRAPKDAEFDLARLAEIATPTLLLSGGESPQWAKDATDALHDAIPNSRIAVLEGQGHRGMDTAPEQFVDVVLAFLDESG